MDRNNEDVLERILQSSPSSAGQRDDAMAMVRAAENLPPVLANLNAFKLLIPAGADPTLLDYFRFALLGVSVGFAERNLSPKDQEHLDIISPLLEDIRIVFERLQADDAEYDPEEFRFQAYDYGIHKAYYLDWRLYLSKELY